MEEKCISKIKDAKTGVCYNVKDNVAREEIENLKANAGGGAYYRHHVHFKGDYDNGSGMPSYNEFCLNIISSDNKPILTWEDLHKNGGKVVVGYILLGIEMRYYLITNVVPQTLANGDKRITLYGFVHHQGEYEFVGQWIGYTLSANEFSYYTIDNYTPVAL